jgi:hypothetical protein
MLRSGVGSDGSNRDWGMQDESADTGCFSAHMVQLKGDSEVSSTTAATPLGTTCDCQAQLRGTPRYSLVALSLIGVLLGA